MAFKREEERVTTITVSQGIYLSVSWIRILFRNGNCRTKKMSNKKQNAILDKKVHMNRVTSASEFCRSRKKGEIGDYMVRHVSHVKQIRYFSRLSDSRQPINLFFYFLFFLFCIPFDTVRHSEMLEFTRMLFFVFFFASILHSFNLFKLTLLLHSWCWCSAVNVRCADLYPIRSMECPSLVRSSVGQCSVVWYRAL